MEKNRSGCHRRHLKAKVFVTNFWNLTPRGRRIRVSNYSLESPKVPKAFDGFRIVQLSDIHGKEFGKNQTRLLEEVKALKPDMILITGDVVQEFYEKKQRRAIVCLYEKLPELAPVYMILGNHETRSPYLPQVLSDIYCSRVKLLRNEGLWLKRDSDRIYLYGLDTGTTSRISSNRDDQSEIESLLNEVHSEIFTVWRQESKTDSEKNSTQNEDRTGDTPFWILMAHKPENFLSFQKARVDLAFSGHAHGGLMKVPGGRLIAPGQGLSPTYTHGHYLKDKTSMIVSQGLGGPRLGIVPELVLTILKRKTNGR